MRPEDRWKHQLKGPVWGHGYCKENDDKAHHCTITVEHVMHKCKCRAQRRG